MPQMSPLWWTTLMLLFIILFFVLMSFLYFNYMNKLKVKLNFITKKYIWNW